MNSEQTVLKENERLVDGAFSAQSSLFDNIQNSSIMLTWMRSIVHRHMEELLKSGDTILDINAGTGIDALHFAKRGHSVHAMDVAEGMVSEIKRKIASNNMHTLITTEQCSFTEAGRLAPKKFDHVFSNFGGLNCVPDLAPVVRQLVMIMKPNGLATLVIMPRICPWEILHLLKGNPDLALRRVKKGGVNAHIEGHYFRTYYHSLQGVIRSFGEEFTVVKVRGVASFSPPPFMEKFPQMFPRIYSLLQRCDERLNTVPPFDRWADQFILTLRFKGR